VSGGTSVNVGATSPAFSNGSFTAGDIIVAQVVLINDAGDTVVPPAGWTSIATQRTDSSNYVSAWFWHLCDGSETGSFTLTWTNSVFFCVDADQLLRGRGFSDGRHSGERCIYWRQPHH
jgi:hypothetical protein